MSSIKMDPSTKDYVIANGSPVEDDTPLTRSYIRLTAPRGGWMYAPNSDWGSGFKNAHARLTSAKTVDDIAQSALQPLIDDGTLSSISTTIRAAGRGYVEMDVQEVDAQGNENTITLNPITGGT